MEWQSTNSYYSVHNFLILDYISSSLYTNNEPDTPQLMLCQMLNSSRLRYACYTHAISNIYLHDISQWFNFTLLKLQCDQDDCFP